MDKYQLTFCASDLCLPLADVVQHCIAFTLLLPQSSIKVNVVAVPRKRFLCFVECLFQSLILQLLLMQTEHNINRS